MVTTLQRDRLTTQTNPAPDSRKLIGIYHLPIGPNLGPVHTGWETVGIGVIILFAEPYAPSNVPVCDIAG